MMKSMVKRAPRSTTGKRFLTVRQREILDFIRAFQKQHGVSPTHREICEEFGYSSYGTVHKHLKLLEQKGYLKRTWNQKRGVRLSKPKTGESELLSGREVPFYGRIAAGLPIEAIASDEVIAVPDHLLARGANNHYVLQVVGDSMIEEGIQDGDLVVVSQRDRAEPGEMVVTMVEDEVTLKRFYPEGDLVRLQPANPTMKALRVPARDVSVQGIVVGLMRRY